EHDDADDARPPRMSLQPGAQRCEELVQDALRSARPQCRGYMVPDPVVRQTAGGRASAPERVLPSIRVPGADPKARSSARDTRAIDGGRAKRHGAYDDRSLSGDVGPVSHTDSSA